MKTQVVLLVLLSILTACATPVQFEPTSSMERAGISPSRAR